MGLPVILTVSLAAADDDGISVSQTPLAAGDLTITGALASGGVATISGSGVERQVIITSGGNDSNKTFTIYGTNSSGTAISEVLTGANAGVAASALMYQTVTRIAVSAATAGTVIAGTNGVGVTRPLVTNIHADNFILAVAAVVTGTANYTLQYTYDDVNKLGGATGQTPQQPTWWDSTGMVTKTGNFVENLTAVVAALRIKLNSGSGTVAATCIQTDMIG